MSKEDSKRRPSMEISISSLDDGDHPFAFEAPSLAIGLDDSFLGHVRVEGSLKRVSRQLILTGTVFASYHKECDRCLAEIRRDAEIPLNLFYRTVMHGERPRVEDEDDADIRLIDPDQESIVLDEEVRQIILLDIPLKVLCKEACKGICPRCGVDLNTGTCRCDEPEIDPRWEKLSGLFKREDQ